MKKVWTASVPRKRAIQTKLTEISLTSNLQGFLLWFNIKITQLAKPKWPFQSDINSRIKLKIKVDALNNITDDL